MTILRDSPPVPAAVARHLAWVCGVVILAMMALFVVAGRFNDEGWYLYAAKLACTGHAPYRDFMYPQPPLTLYLYGPLQALSGGSLLLGRLTAVVVSVGVLALSLRLAARLGGWAGVAFVAACFAVNWYTLYYLTIVKTYPLAALFLLTGAWACLAGRYGAAQVLLLLATLTRLSAVPAVFVACVLEFVDRRNWAIASTRLVGALATVGAVGCGLYIVSDGRLLEQLYLPMGSFLPGLTSYYVGGHEDYPLTQLLVKKAAALFRTGLLYWLPCVGLVWGLRHGRAGAGTSCPREAAVLLAIAAPVGLAHLLARRPYEEYQTIVFPLLCLAAAQLVARGTEAGPGLSWQSTRPRWQLALLAAPLLIAPLRGLNRLDWSGGRSALGELRRAAAVVRAHAPAGDWLLTLEPYLAVESQRRELPPELLMGKYAYHPEWSTARCRRLPVVNQAELYRLLASKPQVVALAPNHFLTANPDRRAQLQAQFDRFVATVRADYELVADFDEFGYSRDTLSLFARTDAPG